jgi:4-aminobutyrate aminotransferase
MTKQEVILANQQYLFPSVFHYFKEPLVVTKAKDQFVWDADGNQYLDFFGGIVTISVGHCNDTVNQKVHEQIDKLWHVSTVFANEPQAALAKRVAEITPGGKLTKSFFTNSGTEANETAVLTARCYTGNHEIVALRHSYHGRSAVAMAATGQASWRLGGAAPSGFVHAINAYCYRCPLSLTYPSCNVQCARDMEEMIRTSTSGRIAGFIAEPIQGVGGFITPPKEYFEIVAGIVKKAGGVFISDEVQTGLGTHRRKMVRHRTLGRDAGHYYEREGARQRIAGWTDGRASGDRRRVEGHDHFDVRRNPVTATAAKAVIDFIDENKLMINAAETGAYLRGKLEEMKAKYPIIGDIRGMGLMQAMELVEDRESKKPDTQATLAVMEAARENRLLIGKGGTYGNVIRVTPPLNISKSDVDDFTLRLDASFKHVTAARMAGAAR